MSRAYTVDNILNRKYNLFDFNGEWADAFSCPERSGVWFIWGNSGNGKTTFILQLIKNLCQFDKVLLNSLEEGASHTIRNGFVRVGMQEVSKKVLIVSESVEEITMRLDIKKSPGIIIIDSFQYFQLSYKQYIEFKRKFPKKLIIFISHADGRVPSGRAAKSVMYDASLKIWVEGYKAFSKGRYIGPVGNYTIWPEGALKYWGE
jgi:hypothetical protein